MVILGLSDEGLPGSAVCQHDLFLGKDFNNSNCLQERVGFRAYEMAGCLCCNLGLPSSSKFDQIFESDLSFYQKNVLEQNKTIHDFTS
jgi:hypothetical protein